MGSVFQNPTVKKRYIPKVQKHEEAIQKDVCKYLRLHYPQVVFRSDYASGLKLTQNQASVHRSLQSSRSWPDLFIYKPMKVDGRQYAGLAIELKADGTSVILKIGPRKGKLSTDEHIQEQALMLRELRKCGYYADFAVGYDQAVNIIDWYFGRSPVLENQPLF
jgi:hypothetical protein